MRSLRGSVGALSLVAVLLIVCAKTSSAVNDDSQTITIRPRDLDHALLQQALQTSFERSRAKRGTLNTADQLKSLKFDRSNVGQAHAPMLSAADTARREEHVRVLQGVHARTGASGAAKAGSRAAVQDWANDPLNNNNGGAAFRIVTWWHIFNTGALKSEEVVARIIKQLEYTKGRMNNLNFAPFELVFGGATVYSGAQTAGWVCNQPATYRTKIAESKAPSRYLNTVVCNRGDNMMGDANFPYDEKGQPYPKGEDDPAHLIQIDPDYLPGGVYGSDFSSRENFPDQFTGRWYMHLLGHFFGLPHVFQDDATCPADGIDNDAMVGVGDTPTQLLPYTETEDCSNAFARGDCGDSDSISLYNFMGYSFCANQFTNGQADRMRQVLIEFHPLLASRQDCETNPCGANLDCFTNQFALPMLKQNGGLQIAVLKNGLDGAFSVPFADLNRVVNTTTCTSGSRYDSAACISAATLFCARSFDTELGFPLNVSPQGLRVICIDLNGITYTQKDWIDLPTCSFTSTKGIYDMDCVDDITAACGANRLGLPVEFNDKSVTIACVNPQDRPTVPLAAFKRYNKICNTLDNMHLSECRQVVFNYGANSHYCTCAQGSPCQRAGQWVVSEWDACTGCTQSRTVSCSFPPDSNCDPDLKPQQSRPCNFGTCTVDVPNNKCSGATFLGGPDVKLLAEERLKLRSDMVTPQTGDPDAAPTWGSACNGTRVSAWYRTSSNSPFNLNIKIRNNTVPMVMSLLSGDCNGIVEVACDTQASPVLSATNLQAGVRYLVRVSSVSGVAGSFDMEVSQTAAAAPPNDACSNALVLTPNATDPIVVRAYVNGATATTSGLPVNASACGTSGNSPDVWYKYTPTESGVLILIPDSNKPADFDPVLSILSGSCANLKLESCVDDVIQRRTVDGMGALVVANQDYFIRVATYNGIVPAYGHDSVKISVIQPSGTVFRFAAGDWGSCQSDCMQYRNVVCNKTASSQVVADQYCLATQIRPAKSQPCCTFYDSPDECDDVFELNSTVSISHSKSFNLSNDKTASLNTSDTFRAPVCYDTRNYLDYWYAIVPKQNVKLTVDVTGVTGYSLAVYESVTGVCTDVTLKACSSASSIVDQVLYQAIPYVVRVARNPADPVTVGNLRYSLTPVIDNDFCDRAPEIEINSTQRSGVISGTFMTATPSTNTRIFQASLAVVPICAAASDSKDVWYSFSSGLGGVFQAWIEYPAQPSALRFKGVLSLHNNCESPSSACARYDVDDPSPVETNQTLMAGRLTSSLSAGNSFLLRVATFDNTDPASFTLRWRLVETAAKPWRVRCSLVEEELYIPNFDVPYTSNPFNTRKKDTTQFVPSGTSVCGDSQSSAAHWLQVTTKHDGFLVAVTRFSNFDTVLSLHKLMPDCGKEVPADSILACDDDGDDGMNSRLTYFVGAGQTYLLRVAGNRNTTGNARVAVVLLDRKPKSSAFWWRGAWSHCSSGCTQTRVVRCVDQTDKPLNEARCLEKKPVTSRSCRDAECPVLWQYAPWSECSKDCVQDRAVTCVAAGRTSYPGSTSCPDSLKPAIKRVCLGGVCPNVKNHTFVEVELKFKTWLLPRWDLIDTFNTFKVNELCPFLIADTPQFTTNPSTCENRITVVDFSTEGRIRLVIQGSTFAREAATALLDFFNNLRNDENVEDQSFFTRTFDAPAVEGFPSASTVFDRDIKKDDDDDNKALKIGLGVGLGVGLFALLVAAVAGGVYWSRRKGGMKNSSSNQGLAAGPGPSTEMQATT